MERIVKVNNHVFMQEIKRLFREEGRKSVTFTVRGRSMHPFLGDERDKVVLVPPLPPRTGQVVLAEIRDKVYALHRIIKIEGETITMLGDGNPVRMVETFTADKLVGTATAFIRKGEYVSVDSRKWRCYSTVWMFLKPVRRYLLAFYHRIIMKISNI